MRSACRSLLCLLIACSLASCRTQPTPAKPRRRGRKRAHPARYKAPPAKHKPIVVAKKPLRTPRHKPAAVLPNPKPLQAKPSVKLSRLDRASEKVNQHKWAEAKIELERFIASPDANDPRARSEAQGMLRMVNEKLSLKKSLDNQFRKAEALYFTRQYGKAKPILVQLKAKAEQLPAPVRRKVDEYLAAIEDRIAQRKQAIAAANKQREQLYKRAELHIKAGQLYDARNILTRLDAERDQLSEEQRHAVAKQLDDIDAQLEKQATATTAATTTAQPTPASTPAAGIDIDIASPAQPISTVTEPEILLTGTVRADNPLQGVTITVNGVEATLRGMGGVTAMADPKTSTISRKVSLAAGQNIIQITASDGKASATTVLVVTLAQGQVPLYGQSWAVLVGINHYQKEPWKDHELTYAAKDAIDVARLLHERFGFAKERIFLLLDSESAKKYAGHTVVDDVREATLANITSTLASLDSRQVQLDDRVLVFFAGHGQTMDLATGGEMGFLVPEDGGGESLGDYFTSALPMQRIRELADIIPAKHVLFLVDACYSGLCTVERRGLPAAVSKYVAKLAKLQARQIITAGLKGEQVMESSAWGNSAFTSKLLEALRSGAADSNGDDYITASELGSYLKPAVTTLTNGAQTPKVACFFGDGEFLFEVRMKR